MESKVRASRRQFLTLLEYMERHGDLGKPQTGSKRRVFADRLWKKLTHTLNSIDTAKKTPDKWKKVWVDWKSKTKKKAVMIQRSHESGGPRDGLSHYLSAAEMRLLKLIGVYVEGHSEIEEQRPSSVPSEQNESDSDNEIFGENGIDPLPPSPQSSLSNNRLSPAAPSPNFETSRSLHRQDLRERQEQTTDLHTSRSPHRQYPRMRQGKTTDRETSRSHYRQYQRVRQRQTTEQESPESIEHRRIRLDEIRERNEARRLEVEAERNNVLTRFADIAQAFLDQYMQNNRLINGQHGNDSE